MRRQKRNREKNAWTLQILKLPSGFFIPSNLPTTFYRPYTFLPANSIDAPRQTPKGTPLEGTYNRTLVVFDLPSANGTSLSAFLQAMIKEPFANSPHIKDLVSTGGEARFFISIFCTGNYAVSIDPSLLTALGARHLGLDLTVYPEAT